MGQLRDFIKEELEDCGAVIGWIESSATEMEEKIDSYAVEWGIFLAGLPDTEIAIRGVEAIYQQFKIQKQP